MDASATLDPQSEAMLQQALGFLTSPKVRASDDVQKKRGFLQAKGLSESLIEVAFQRASAVPAESATAGLTATLSNVPAAQPQPTAAATPATPYSSKFLEVMMAVQRGEDLPGVRTIDDKPRAGSTFTPVASDASRPKKPWEKNRTPSESKPYVAGLNGGNGIKYVKPAADPREEQAADPPPVGAADDLAALKQTDQTQAIERESLMWQPIEPAEWSSTDLADYAGQNQALPTLVSLDGLVFNVSTSESFTAGTGYNALAGRDASRALSVMSLDQEHLRSDVESCTEEELGVLSDWVIYFKDKKKYPLVGHVPSITRKTTVPVPELDENVN